jgi:hypothetical protein
MNGMQAQAEDRVLLDLFIQHTRSNLEAEIIAACKPSIDRAVDQAIKELQVDINRHYDVVRHQTAVVVSLR